LKHHGCTALPVANQHEQDVRGADVVVAEPTRLGGACGQVGLRGRPCHRCPRLGGGGAGGGAVSSQPAPRARLAIAVLLVHGLFGDAEQGRDLLPAPAELARTADLQLLDLWGPKSRVTESAV
jgi:hypothetical protein